MPKLNVPRLSLGVVGLLLCALPLTGASLVERAEGPAPAAVDASDIALVAGRCGGFGPKHVLRGKVPRAPASCRPIGLDGEVVRTPIRKADRRDARNYRNRGVHGKRGRHHGTDFRARCGTPVRAAHDGKVIVVKRKGRRLDSVGVSTGPRRLTTWYAGLGRVSVRHGAVVNGGKRLGRIQRAKRSRGCHLHFSVQLRGGARDPLSVNPSRWWRRHVGAHVSGMAPAKRRKGAFIAATFNVLGHSHTAAGGKKRRQFAGSARRMQHAISLLRSNRVALVGLQEFQGVQRTMFQRQTRGWAVFSPRDDPQDSIAWKRSRFRALKTRTVKIPYFRGERPMPVVLLRDRATGRRLVVISVHNPANRGSVRRMTKRRAVAVRRELRMVRAMRRSTGAPVILMGDFNDSSRKFFCRVTRHGLKASSGGVRGRGCRPAQGAGIDWIFGTRGVRFTAHQKVLGGLVERTTDHPLVLARVRR